jgi:hypothetical protein
VLLVAFLRSVFDRTNNENGIAAGLLDGDVRALTMPVAVIVRTAATATVLRLLTSSSLELMG